ncbi:unnamed protein product [Coregonus sp. 'balchen']|nr:unnamed protein product [Coregonus sp. 'balchen']
MVVLRDVVQTYPEVRIILMSATIDTTMFREYYFNCPVIEVFGRTFAVQDCIQMTHFIPPLSDRKRKDKDEEGGDEEANCNVICGPEYTPETKRSMAQINEKETPFELVEALLKYIETLQVTGAVLVFLPGWNLIYSMQKHLEMNPHFGSQRYLILPLHSQIPREEQRRVFEPVPENITKVILLETHMTPEIFRTPLHEVALSIKLLRLGSIGHFLSKAIEPPPLDALPIEPRLGKMMIMGCIFNVGDAVCTISAASCFPEPFINDGKRLRYVHRNFAGTRFSDHVALLSVFQAWDDVRMGGEDAESRFCEHKRLNMSTLRMTWEAKMFNNVGPDNNLDVVISLLTYGSYPNVCYHKEKRKILTTEGRNALIHKCSVNCPFSSQDMTYPSRSSSLAKRIKLKIPHDVAGCIAALRAGMEALVVEVTKDPEYIRQLDPTNERMLNIIRQISKPSAAGLNLMVNNLRWAGLMEVEEGTEVEDTEVEEEVTEEAAADTRAAAADTVEVVDTGGVRDIRAFEV